MSETGGRIVELRENLNISQLALAKKVGLSATTLSKYEKNLREPRADIIIKLADALQTTTDYLLCRTSDNSPIRKDISWIKTNTDESLVLKAFRRLPERGKGQLIERLKVLCEEFIEE